MTLAVAPDREFVTFDRGDVREMILISFRNGLRQLINPDTGLLFTEPEIATATGNLSRYYDEADGIDLVELAGQQRAAWLADQVDPTRASTEWLENYHGRQWIKDGRLGAAGGSGAVSAPATPGTTFIGSTTVPDAAATYGTAPDGKRFQVLQTVTTDGTGVALLLVIGVDTGTETNLPAGTELTWSNPPLGSTGKATVLSDFTGGVPAENDADYAKRILSVIRHRPAAGNNAHFRAWARESTAAIEDACIYACAFHAGSVLVAVSQKRGTTKGPNARVASVGTLTRATSYLVSPASPVVPNPPHVLVVPWNPEPCDMTIGLAMPNARASGWADLQPWPRTVLGVGAVIGGVSDQTHFEILTDDELPSGVTAPQLMVWNEATSEFERLEVQIVEVTSPGVWDVVLAAPSVATIVSGMPVSPYTARHELIAATITAYFDSLGPGEVIDLEADNRAHRAYRFPEPSEELPQRAGQSVTNYLQDAMGSALADSGVLDQSITDPPLPADIADGPSYLVAGQIGVYPF